MADTTVTVRQDGTGDYTTIASAEAAADISTGYYKIEIDDSNAYDETVTVNVTGSPAINRYVWITVSEGNRHSGVAGTGHARISHSGSYTNGFAIESNYTRVEYLEMEGFVRPIYATAENILVSRCILHGASFQGFAGNANGQPAVDNCLIYGNFRGVFSGTSTVPRTEHFDHCTIVDNSGTQTRDTNVWFYMFRTVDTITSGWYNNVLGDGYAQDIVVTNNTGNLTLNGSHNAWDTDTSQFGSATNNLTDSQDISSGGVTTITTTANAYIVDDLSPGAENYTPVPATGAGSNLVLGNGTNRQGSEPDPRQDFSTDIRGATRPTTAGFIDIGAFQITQEPASFKYWDGAAWVDSTNVQYWNGSAWTDVTGIQYWNGSAWTDPS